MSLPEPTFKALAEWRPMPDPGGRRNSSFVSGDPNGDAIRARYWITPEDHVAAQVWFGPRCEGPPDHAHGGSIAAVLDELMGCVCWTRGHPSVAGEIRVRFHHSIPLGQMITGHTSIRSVKGRKVKVEAFLYDPSGRCMAESSGVFVELPEERASALRTRMTEKGLVTPDQWGTAC